MSARPLLNLRDEPLSSNGYRRLHLISSDGLGSETAIWLRAGCTAIVVWLLDAGMKPAAEIALKEPIDALRAFAADTGLQATVRTKNGPDVTALDIQRRYLDVANDHFSKQPAGSYPAWINDVLRGWAEMLRLLGTDVTALDTVLDWRVKLAVYQDFCERKGVSWASLSLWNDLIERLQKARRGMQAAARARLQDLMKADGPVKAEAERLTSVLRRAQLTWDDLPRVLKLRAQLFELDTRFLQLDDGVFHRLNDSGELNHQVVTDRGSIDRAVLSPPQGSRAAARGAFVKSHAGDGNFSADWMNLYDRPGGQVGHLEDPFAESPHWQELPAEYRRHMSLRERHRELMARVSAQAAFDPFETE